MADITNTRNIAPTGEEWVEFVELENVSHEDTVDAKDFNHRMTKVHFVKAFDATDGTDDVSVTVTNDTEIQLEKDGMSDSDVNLIVVGERSVSYDVEEE